MENIPLIEFALGGVFMISFGVLSASIEKQSVERLSRSWAIAQVIAGLACCLLVAAYAVKHGAN